MKLGNLPRAATLAASALALTLSGAACSLDDGYDDHVAYTTAPAAWGPPGICYFLYSPLECAGYGLTPVIMPTYWHARYADFYDHDRGYLNRIPAQYRDRWDDDGREFARRNAKLIRKESSFGDWKDLKTNQKVSGVRPAQIDKSGKPLSAAGSKTKTVDKTVNASGSKRRDWGFSSKNTTTKNQTSKTTWGFGTSTTTKSGFGSSSSGRRP